MGLARTLYRRSQRQREGLKPAPILRKREPLPPATQNARVAGKFFAGGNLGLILDRPAFDFQWGAGLTGIVSGAALFLLDDPKLRFRVSGVSALTGAAMLCASGVDFQTLTVTDWGRFGGIAVFGPSALLTLFQSEIAALAKQLEGTGYQGVDLLSFVARRPLMVSGLMNVVGSLSFLGSALSGEPNPLLTTSILAFLVGNIAKARSDPGNDRAELAVTESPDGQPASLPQAEAAGTRVRKVKAQDLVRGAWCR